MTMLKRPTNIRSYLSGRKQVALLKLTYKCNQRCIFCYEYLNTHNKNTDAYIEISSDKILKYLLRLKQQNYDTVIISGGEPLHDKNLFNIVLTSLKKMKMTPILITNGTLLNTSYIKKFRENNLELVYVSLHAHNSYLNAFITRQNFFEKVINNITSLLKSNINVVIRIVMNKFIIDDLDSYIDFCITKFKKHGNFLIELSGMNIKGVEASAEAGLSFPSLTPVQNTIEKTISKYGKDLFLLDILPLCLFSNHIDLFDPLSFQIKARIEKISEYNYSLHLTEKGGIAVNECRSCKMSNHCCQIFPKYFNYYNDFHPLKII